MGVQSSMASAVTQMQTSALSAPPVPNDRLESPEVRQSVERRLPKLQTTRSSLYKSLDQGICRPYQCRFHVLISMQLVHTVAGWFVHLCSSLSSNVLQTGLARLFIYIVCDLQCLSHLHRGYVRHPQQTWQRTGIRLTMALLTPLQCMHLHGAR